MRAAEQLKLVITEGPSKGREFSLDKKTTGIGRDPKNQVVIDGQSVSLFHARINLEPGGCSITNLGSIEGVKVNNKNVDNVSLSAGDRVQIGNVKMRVQAGSAPSRPEPSSGAKKSSGKPGKKRRFRLQLKPSIIIICLLAALAGVVLFNVRWLGIIMNW